MRDPLGWWSVLLPVSKRWIDVYESGKDTGAYYHVQCQSDRVLPREGSHVLITPIAGV